MHLSTRLECDLVAVEAADELTLLVELTAPAPTASPARQPATLQVVLDRSGSMAGDRLAGALHALAALVDRLDPTDNFGVVAFDNTVQVVVPAGPLTDKAAVKAALAMVGPGGATDLSSGYLRGLQEARRVAGPSGATVLIVSDGHANSGVTDPVQLGSVAAEAQHHGVTTSTLGFGLGYDETLLAAIARGGAGNELFAEEADTAVALIGGEVDHLLAQVAQATSLRVRWSRHVASADILNDLPTAALPDGFVVELGSFVAGETRRLIVRLQVPGIAALGHVEVATLELTHVSLPDLVQHTTTTPVHVNVVPGDQATGRVRDPEVRCEALFQRTQQDKRRSSRLLSEGRVAEASFLLRQTSTDLHAAATWLPQSMSAELSQEALMMASLADEAGHDVQRAAKVSSADATSKSRTRGRHSRGGAHVLRWANDSHDPDASVVLEEWEAVRLARLLPPELRPALKPGEGVQPPLVAGLAAQVLLDTHPLGAFFAGASGHGGFVVERA